MIITPEEAQEKLLRKRQEWERTHPNTAQPASEDITEALNRIKGQCAKATEMPEDDYSAEERRRKIDALRSEWHAPLRHLKAPVDYGDEWGAKLKDLQGRAGTGFLVALIGGRGRGKTQIAVELMKQATERLKSARYATGTEFFMDIKATYKAECRKTEREIIKEYRNPKFLVLDEVARRGETDWEDRLLFELLDKRYQDERDTLLISNQERKDFLDSIGPSLASRMQETGGIIECNWRSYRV